MRAVWLREFGGPEVLGVEETPEPVPAPGQVLIQVEYANITWVETMFRANGVGPFPQPPLIPGNGVGGVIVAAGSSSEEPLVGKRVVTGTGGAGGYAELAAVNAASVIEVPADVPTDDAVALLADGRTALMIIDAAGIKPGDRVLVEAAAGGVGSLLVQLAVAAGANVVAVAGGPRKVALARELGAGEAIDYLEPGWAEAVGRVDVVLDGVGGAIAEAAFDLLDRDGRMISFGFSSAADWPDVSEQAATERGVRVRRGVFGKPDEQIRRSTEALALAAAARLRPVIGQRFPLERADDAHRVMESRAAVGKTLLTV
ncbi:zinc-binding dehydrogenase [Actinoallomurus bryophytorum]|uniref:NADPH2:quinone reductase n=1 Tax=Actinoallomurus bryophytorum TaxID=1490222 RepID=A0A543CSH2_9ACTN|nr:zinc-binding dehydrogenase [Actinoallomurus bryophytorum]TQM00063.1 NADPH2:quinone reductase [Actinoallomurus bryophytorum]